MKKQFRLLTIACLIGGMLHLTGCKKDDVVPAPTGINLTSHSTLGSILTDNKGQTLYFFSQDANGQSSCTSGCTSAWPVFHTAGTPVVGTGLADADFGELTRADGTKQTTFKGWPLYYFAPNNDGKLEKLEKVRKRAHSLQMEMAVRFTGSPTTQRIIIILLHRILVITQYGQCTKQLLGLYLQASIAATSKQLM